MHRSIVFNSVFFKKLKFSLELQKSSFRTMNGWFIDWLMNSNEIIVRVSLITGFISSIENQIRPLPYRWKLHMFLLILGDSSTLLMLLSVVISDHTSNKKGYDFILEVYDWGAEVRSTSTKPIHLVHFTLTAEKVQFRRSLIRLLPKIGTCNPLSLVSLKSLNLSITVSQYAGILGALNNLVSLTPLHTQDPTLQHSLHPCHSYTPASLSLLLSLYFCISHIFA